MGKTIGIIGCSKSKNDPSEWDDAHPDADAGDDVETLPLQYLYSSGFWTVKSRYGREVPDEWRILSGKFGLVSPDVEVEDTYERTLHNMSDEEIAEWAEMVREQSEALAEKHSDATLKLVLGGPYFEQATEILADLPFTVKNPVEGAGGMGIQMRMLNERVDEAQNADLNQH